MDSKLIVRILMILGVLLLVALAVGGIALLVLNAIAKRNVNAETIFSNKKKNKRKSEAKLINRYRPIYLNLAKISFVDGILQELRRTYAISNKGKIEYCQAMAAKFITNYIWSLYGAVVAFTLLTPKITSVFTMSFFVTAFYLLKFRKVYNTMTLKLQSELYLVLDRIRFHYSSSNNVLMAVKEAGKESRGVVRAHLLEIVDFLEVEPDSVNSNKESAIESEEEYIDRQIGRYTKQDNNNFVRTLFMLCSTSIAYGESKSSDENTFLSGIKELKDDVKRSNLSLQKSMYVSGSKMMATIIPILACDFMANWGRNLIAGMEVYYDGIYEVLGYFIVYLVSAVSFYLCYIKTKDVNAENKVFFLYTKLAKIKVFSKPIKQYYNKHYSKEVRLNRLFKDTGSTHTVVTLFIQSVTTTILVFVVGTTLLYVGHNSFTKSLLSQADEITVMTSNYSPETKENAVALHKEMLEDYIHWNKMEYADYKDAYAEVLPKLNVHLAGLLAESTQSQIAKIYNSYVRWWEIMIVLALACASFNLPLIILKRGRKDATRRMKEETIRIRGVVNALKGHDNMTPKILLEWMEKFAYIFRPSIIKARSSLNSGEMEALLELQNSETFEPFRSLIGDMIMTDTIGVQMAYMESANTRKHDKADMEHEDEVRLDGIKNLLFTLQLVPFYAFIGVYFMFPIVMFAATTTISAFSSLNTLQ